MHRWPMSFPVYALERSLVHLPHFVSLGLSEFLGNKILFRQPALEVDDDLPGGLFRICPADTTLDLSPVEMIVPLVPSM